MSITVTACKAGLANLYNNVFMVRGYGKRAILVLVRANFAGGILPLDEVQDLAKLGAEYAAKRSWKKVVVAPDGLYQEYACVFNWHQYFYESFNCGFDGHNLAYIGDGSEPGDWREQFPGLTAVEHTAEGCSYGYADTRNTASGGTSFHVVLGQCLRNPCIDHGGLRNPFSSAERHAMVARAVRESVA